MFDGALVSMPAIDPKRSPGTSTCVPRSGHARALLLSAARRDSALFERSFERPQVAAEVCHVSRELRDADAR